MGILPPFLGPGWDLPPKHLSNRTFCAISAWVRRSPVGSPLYLMDSSLGYSAVPLLPITITCAQMRTSSASCSPLAPWSLPGIQAATASCPT
jgi:hypothetical protein